MSYKRRFMTFELNTSGTGVVVYIHDYVIPTYGYMRLRYESTSETAATELTARCSKGILHCNLVC